MSDDALPLGPIDPGEKQSWLPSLRADPAHDYAIAMAAKAQSDLMMAEFEAKVVDGWGRYQNDAEFHHRANVLARVLYGGTRSNGIVDAIRALVAIEEMDGGVLDLRL